MTTTSLIREGTHQIVKLPKEFEFAGINQVEIRKKGNSLIITPLRKSWKSFANLPQADEDFLLERSDIFQENRVTF
jgi:antitoxin VapB